MADPDCTEEAGTPDDNGVGKNAGRGTPVGGTPPRQIPYLGTAGARPLCPCICRTTPTSSTPTPDAILRGHPSRFNGNGTMTIWNTGSAGKSVTGPGLFLA